MGAIKISAGYRTKSQRHLHIARHRRKNGNPPQQPKTHTRLTSARRRRIRVRPPLIVRIDRDRWMYLAWDPLMTGFTRLGLASRRVLTHERKPGIFRLPVPVGRPISRRFRRAR